MISPASTALITVGIVATNTVLDDKKKISARFVIGSGIYLIFLAVLNESDPNLASRIGLLVLVGALLVNGADIFKKVGVS